jgi:hypothetical protein
MRAEDELWEDIRASIRARLAEDGLEHLFVMGDMYVNGLRWAQELRADAEAKPTVTLSSGRVITHSGFLVSDRLLKTSLQVAKALGLNKPRAEPVPGDELAALYAFRELDAAADQSTN